LACNAVKQTNQAVGKKCSFIDANFCYINDKEIVSLKRTYIILSFIEENGS